MLSRGEPLPLLVLSLLACSTPAPPPPPPAPAPLLPGLGPLSPPGTEGLRAAPCSRRIDLSATPAEQRAFGPAARPFSDRTSLAFRVLAPGARWSWSSSRPGALRFEDGPPGAVTLVAVEPGATLARLVLDGAGTAEPEEATVLVSVPMFARVRADADLAAMLERDFGLAGRERAVMAEAARAVDAVFAGVNVRVAFEVGLGEALPAGLPEGGFIEATLHGAPDRCATPQGTLIYTEIGGYGEGDAAKRLVRAPVHVCPAFFRSHPDTMAAMIKDRARLLADDASAALYAAIVGRAIGELVAHEIGHQLLGCDYRGERRFWRCHDRLPHSLMNRGGDRSFTDRTGVVIKPTPYASIWRGDFPAPGTYEDHGVEAINRMAPDEQAVLAEILPAPPALGEVAPCGREGAPAQR